MARRLTQHIRRSTTYHLRRSSVDETRDHCYVSQRASYRAQERLFGSLAVAQSWANEKFRLYIQVSLHDEVCKPGAIVFSCLISAAHTISPNTAVVAKFWKQKLALTSFYLQHCFIWTVLLCLLLLLFRCCCCCCCCCPPAAPAASIAAYQVVVVIVVVVVVVVVVAVIGADLSEILGGPSSPAIYDNLQGSNCQGWEVNPPTSTF